MIAVLNELKSHVYDGYN